VDRVLTIPNVISIVRLCCIPWFLYLVFGVEEEYQAAWLLAVLGCTDWVDGFIARRFNQVSTFGKVADPAADRLLLGVAAITLMVIGAMPWWFGIAALTREVLIGAGGIYLGLKGHQRLDVAYVGKVGAFGLMMSFPFFLAAHSGVWWHEWATVGAWVCGAVGLTFSWYSFFGYFRQAKRVLNGTARQAG
jgi:cardiolipin synthase